MWFCLFTGALPSRFNALTVMYCFTHEFMIFIYICLFLCCYLSAEIFPHSGPVSKYWSTKYFNKSNEAEAFKLQTAPNVTGSSMQKRSFYFKKYLSVCFTKESHVCVSVLLFRALCIAESFSLYLGQCLIATN